MIALLSLLCASMVKLVDCSLEPPNSADNLKDATPLISTSKTNFRMCSADSEDAVVACTHPVTQEPPHKKQKTGSVTSMDPATTIAEMSQYYVKYTKIYT